MKPIIFFSLLLIGLQVHGDHTPEHHDGKDDHGGHNQPEEHGNKTTACHKIARSNADFAFRFFKHVTSDGAPKNVLYSPSSISTAFALLTLGAQSETKSQIHKGLAFNLTEIEEKDIHEGFHHLIHTLNRPNNKAQVNTGNALFIEESRKLLPKFLEDTKAFYEADGFSANFKNPSEAEKQINLYVQNKTHGKITDAVKDLDTRTILVIINYIFFKAYWEYPFSTAFIREADFFVDANTTVKVNMMFRGGYYKYFHDEDLACSVVEVPYKGEAAALFILPDEGKLQDVERALEKETLLKWSRSFTSNRKIHLHIPKFSVSASYDLKDSLGSLGMTKVFSDAADLSGITGERNLKVSKAVHKAVLEVHENGTEAAAVTALEISLTSAIFPPPLIFRCDRPFLVIIFDEQTHSILFIAKIVDPTKK